MHVLSESVWQFCVLALAIGAVAMTLTKSTVFGGFRRLVKSKSDFFGELVNCPYCTSHWLAIATVLVYQPRLVQTSNLIADFVASGFALVAAASVVCGWIFKGIASIPAPKDPPAPKS